jgi:ABC-type cobalamin/Fe3+-siderophores transport system ATPase subunit
LPADAGFDRCVAEFVGLDGRAIRKTVANALAVSPQTAMHPEQVTLEDVVAAARAAKANRLAGGKKP